MICQSAKLLTTTDTAVQSCSVNSQTLMAEFAEKYLPSPQEYLVVEDDRGAPMGVVAKEEIRRRLDSVSPAERDRWMNTPIEAAVAGSMTPPAPRMVRRFSRNPGGFSLECTVILQDGALVALSTEQDVFVSWQSIEQTLQTAQCDHLTQLPVRSVFERHLRAEFSRAVLQEHSLAVMLIDVDHFKQINDQFGHPAGDYVLSVVGGIIRKSFRSYDLVSRFGGDEFAVLCCGCQPGEIDLTIERLSKSMRQLGADLPTFSPVPTLSIGVCVAHHPAELQSPLEIVNRADECLYAAKRNGRNCAFVTEPGEADTSAMRLVTFVGASQTNDAQPGDPHSLEPGTEPC